MFAKSKKPVGAVAVAEAPESEVAALERRREEVLDMIETEKRSSLEAELTRVEIELVEAKRRAAERERAELQRQADALANELRAVGESIKPHLLKVLDGLERIRQARVDSSASGLFTLVNWQATQPPAPVLGIVAASNAVKLMREWASSPNR